MYAYSAISFLLLANGVASAPVQRKRFTVNTDAKQPSDAFGLAEPFGFDRALAGSMSMCMSMRSMCMSMSMRMDMSMSVDVIAAVENPIFETDVVTDDAEEEVVLVADGTRYCPEASNEVLNDVEVVLTYELRTSADVDVEEVIDNVENAILDGAAASLIDCDEETRRRLRDADFSLKKIDIESEVSEELECTPVGDGQCNVVVSTLTVSTDSDVPPAIIGAKTLTVLEDSLMNTPIEGAQLVYKPVETQSAPPAESVKQTPKEEYVADEEVEVSGGSGVSGAAAGAIVAGVLAVVFGGVALALKKRSSSSAREEYFGQDVPETPDLA